MKLACYDLPLPPSIAAQTPLLLEKYGLIVEQLGSPFVLKEISSDRGRNNYLIRTKKEYIQILEEAPTDHAYVAQKFIKNDGFLRLYVTNKEVGLVIKRTEHVHADPLKSHLNKPAGSVNAHLVPVEEVSQDIKELAVKAAVCMERQIAGVDLIQDKNNGEWYILEVNNGPQLRSGSFIDEKARVIAQYFDRELER